MLLRPSADVHLKELTRDMAELFNSLLSLLRITPPRGRGDVLLKAARLSRPPVAPIFGPRGIAKLVRGATACGEMGTPQPHQACAWLLAIFLKIDSNVAYACFSTVS
jgi:hypothetical protein